MLDEAEGTLGLVAVDHEPDPELEQLHGLALVRPEHLADTGRFH